MDADDMERWIIEFTNRERTGAGLSPLSHDPAISDIARAHSTNMVESGMFSQRYSYGLAENIAKHPRVRRWTGTTSRGQTSWRPAIFNADAEEMAEALVQQWMDSPGHRENILKPSYSRIGVGVHVQESPEYGYQNETVFAAQNFSSCK